MQDLNAGTVADYFSSGNVQCGAAEWVQLFKYTDGGGNTQSGAVADPVCRRDLLLRRCNGSFFKLSYHGPVGLGVSEFDA
jgi:hypothetical protein